MKIIKPGDLRRSCVYCGAVVELAPEDIIVTDFGSVQSRHWVCPCCGRKIHDI